jgi:hypothetical protein
MKYLRISYTKLVMLEVEDDFTEEDASALVDEIAEDEIFRDGVDWDDVEWDIDPIKEA